MRKRVDGSGGGSSIENLGLPTDPFKNANPLPTLTEDQDFSPVALAKRNLVKKIDYRETQRELNRKIANLENTPVEPVGYGGVSQRNLALAHYQQQAQDLASAENARYTKYDLSQFPVVKKILSEVNKQPGVYWTQDDVENLINWQTVNDAADTILANKENPDATINVLLSLQKTNPVMAAIVPQVIDEKLKATFKDPSVLETVTANVLGALKPVMDILVAENETSMHVVRTVQYGVQNIGDAGSGDAWTKTEKGQFNQEYLDSLRLSGNYTPLQLDVAEELARRTVNGDPDPVGSLWSEKYAGNVEAAAVFNDFAYNRGDGTMQELYRQVMSAHMGSIGNLARGAGEVGDQGYDPGRGTSTYANVTDVVDFASSLTFDGLNLAAGAGAAFKAARWNLAKLAPGAKSAAEVLKVTKVGGLTVKSPAYRYFENFTNDLNRLDDLEARATAASNQAEYVRLQGDAAELRTMMSRQYDEMPEQLIEDFRKNMQRNADGKFDVETAAKWIDDTNQAYLLQSGKVAQQLFDVAAADAAKRASLIKVLEEAPEGSKAAKKAQGAITDLDRNTARQTQKLQGELQDAHDATFYSQVASSSMHRTPLIPRMSVVGQARKNAVNAIKVTVSPSKFIDKMIAKHLPRLDSADNVAQDLNANAEALGAEVRTYRKINTIDSTARFMSSLPDVGMLVTSDASSTRAFYRMARAFLPKRLARVLAEQWRNGDVGSRRLLVVGVVKSAAAVRGVTLTDDVVEQVLAKYPHNRVVNTTGVARPGESYGVTVQGGMLPSERAAAVAGGLEDPMLAGSELNLSVDAAGTPGALHVDQTADAVQIPSMQDFEDLRVAQGLEAQFYHGVGRVAETTTNWWSVWTLFPKLSIRTVVEELGIYFGSGRSISGIAKGRAADQVLRRARPRFYIKRDKEGNIVQDAKGHPVIRRKSSLGIVANKLEWLSLRLKGANPEGSVQDFVANFIYSAVRTDDALEAARRFAAGDKNAYDALIVKAQVAHKLGWRRYSTLNNDDMRFLEHYVQSQHAMQLLDQVAEAGTYLATGNMPRFMVDSESINASSAGVTFGQLKSTDVKFGDWGNVAPVRKDASGNLIMGDMFWWENLRMILDTDGEIGAVAVSMLEKPAEAKAEIARIIRESKNFDYKGRFSQTGDDLSIDNFANRYFENVFQHFTKADGTLNLKLRDRFMITLDDGERVPWFYKPDPDNPELLVEALPMSELEDIPTELRPAYVFGRAVTTEPWIPIAGSEGDLLSGERAMRWMGRQNARVSKGPIFLGNAFDQWNQTAPLRERLAQNLAEAAGRKTPSEADIVLAEQMYFRTSVDTAYSQTMAFVDNPSNRSNLAWKARNVSRYYRATEDFWRRMWRLAKTKPITFWRGALLYHALVDTSFVYRDDNGDAYLGYPGNEQLLNTVTAGLSLFGLNAQRYTDVDPFMIGGRLLGATPSTDPNQQLPTIMGPLAVGLTAAYDAFPALYEMKGLQKLTLGQYSQVSGNLIQDVLNAATPGVVKRVMKNANPDELDSQLLQSGFDALAIMAAEGKLDTLTMNGEPFPEAAYDPVKFRLTDQFRASQMISWADFVVRTFFNTTGPASATDQSNTVSKEARDLGVTGIKPLYRMYLQTAMDNGDPDPWASAWAMFSAGQAQRIVDGKQVSLQSMLPFTLSTYKNNTDSPTDAVAALAKVNAGAPSLITWWNSAEVRDLVAHGHRNAALFLAPDEPGFSWDSWNLAKFDLGIKVKKSDDDLIQDLISINGSQQDSTIRKMYEELIAGQDPNTEQGAQAIKDYKAAMESDRKYNRAINPGWDLIAGQSNPTYNQSNYRKAYDDMRGMLTYLRKRDGELSGTALQIDAAMNIWLHYSAKKKMVEGTAAQKAAATDQIDAEMTGYLVGIKETDPRAGVFIESVLDNLSYDPAYPMFGAQ